MIRMTVDDLHALLSREPAASPATSADSEALRLVLQEEPEYEQHKNMAGAAAAVIERLRDAIGEMRRLVGGALNLIPEAALDVMVDRIHDLRASRDKTRDDALLMDAGARESITRALGRPELKMWVEIEGAVRELVAERERTLLTLAAHTKESLFDAATRVRTERDAAIARIGKPTPAQEDPDAVPVLRFGDVGAHAAVVHFDQPDGWALELNDVVRIGQWRYRVIDCDGWGVAGIMPLDGAPVVPTGEGLTIARAPQDDPWTPADELRATLERLDDERARHEQRRLDLAKKMALVPSVAGWDVITDHAELHGLLSPPVLRFALAMQERIDATKGGEWRRSMEWDHLCACMSGAATNLDSYLRNDRPREQIRGIAADVAVYAMALAQNEGDLDSFDARAEIERARGQESGA